MSASVEGLSLVTVIALIRKEIAESGVEGVAGEDGKQGAKGERGAKGDTGPQGKVGPKGGDGKQGRAGRDGKDGSDGSDGVDGVGIQDIQQDIDGAIVVTMTDGESYTIEMPLNQGTEVHYKVNGGGSGGGSGTVDLSNYVKRPVASKRDGSWLVYRETADGSVKEWAAVTTDLVATNPDVLFRDAKGRFKSVTAPDLKNQLEVNRWLLEQIEETPTDLDIKLAVDAEAKKRSDTDIYLDEKINAGAFFTDIGSNTIQFIGDELWVTSLADPIFIGAKLGSDSSFSGTVTANKFVGDGSQLTGLATVGYVNSTVSRMEQQIAELTAKLVRLEGASDESEEI